LVSAEASAPTSSCVLANRALGNAVSAARSGGAVSAAGKPASQKMTVVALDWAMAERAIRRKSAAQQTRIQESPNILDRPSRDSCRRALASARTRAALRTDRSGLAFDLRQD